MRRRFIGNLACFLLLEEFIVKSSHSNAFVPISFENVSSWSHAGRIILAITDRCLQFLSQKTILVHFTLLCMKAGNFGGEINA